MKNAFFLLLLFFSTFGFSQSTCLDFSNYDNSYLNAVTFDDVTYPIGSSFMSSGDIRLIKYDNSFYQFIDTNLNQMCYIGVIGIDLSTSNYSCKSLTFNLIAGINVIIDGDTNAVASGASYSNANWNMTMSSGSPMLVTITGDFDLVEINNSTTCISNICLASCSSNSSCIDFSNYDNSYLNDVTSDDTTYPIGSAFISSGDLNLVKYDNTFYQFIDTVNNRMCYIGALGIDVANAPFSCKTLTFELIAGMNVIIDGDTNIVSAGANYSNANWNMTMSSGSPMLVTITGNFDLVTVNSSTICISNICLSTCSSTPSCIDFSNYDNAYLNNVTSDDTTYPVGSAFISSGDLNLVKYDNTFYQFIDTVNNRMCYIGALGIDVANAPFSCKTLTFELIAGMNVIIDGDTNIVSAGASYSNANWNMTMSSGSPMLVTITGNFDFVTINSSTICISNICLASCSSTPSCIDFSNYDNVYLNNVTSDDTTYPVGSAFISSGDLNLVKHDNTFYQFIDTVNNQMCFIGTIGIDVANAPYSCRTLTFNLVAGTNIIIDGVSSPVYSDSSYSNANWDMTLSAGNPMLVTITGDFDLVTINTSTICISNICLGSCDSTAGIENENSLSETLFDIYPNPINDKLHINIGSKNYSISVFDLQGNKVMSASDLSDAEEISVSYLKSGMYLICVELEDGSVLTKRVVKN